MNDNLNPYKPEIVTVEDTWFETQGDRAIKTLKVVFDDEEKGKLGTSSRAVCHDWRGCRRKHDSSPVRPRRYLRFSVMRAGKDTGPA